MQVHVYIHVHWMFSIFWSLRTCMYVKWLNFSQVGKIWAPSFVYIGDCEKTWQKKVPKTDKVWMEYSHSTHMSFNLFSPFSPILKEWKRHSLKYWRPWSQATELWFLESPQPHSVRYVPIIMYLYNYNTF